MTLITSLEDERLVIESNLSVMATISLFHDSLRAALEEGK